jgi:RNA polymerase sigma factor (sigma-70 family)
MKLTDKEIFKAIRARDEYLTGKIYRMYREEFIATLKKTLWNDEEILDVFHDAFLDFCNNIYENKINENNLTSSLKTYLFSIGKYKIYNINRKNKNAPIQILNEIPDVKDDEPCFDEENEMIIRKAVSEMGEPCCTILRKQYWEDKNGEIIAAEMNYKNKDALKTQKYKCIQKLKKELKKKIAWQN